MGPENLNTSPLTPGPANIMVAARHGSPNELNAA
jgi:hypothetical protein